MKLGAMIFLLMALQVSMMLFYTPVSVENTDAIPDVYNGSNMSISIMDVETGTSTAKFFQFIADPTRWSSSAFIIGLIAFIVLMAASGVRVFGMTLVSSDTVRFAAIFLVLFGLGSIPIIGLWGLISKEITSIACGPDSISCFASWVVSFICTLPLTVTWFLACLSHWRTGTTQS